MKLGDLIRELRADNELSQQEVALKIGISRSVLSQYENNLVEPTANVVKKFAAFFDVSADYLLGLENDFGARVASPMGEGSGYSLEERKLVEDYRALNSAGKKLVKQTVETLRATSAQSVQNTIS